MTRAEAIRRLESMATDLTGACVEAQSDKVSEYIAMKIQAIDMAIAALKEQDVTDINVGNKWISVKDRLPEDLPENEGRKVIQCIVALKSCYPSGKATIQKRQRQVLYGYDWNPCGWEWSRIGKSRVTHWMPPPEPPKEDAE